jgi:DNA end-binding protein Ku
VKIDPQLLGLAQHILKNKTATFDPSRFVDRYEQAVIEMLETKRKGLPQIVRPVTAPGLPIDLMAALKKSLEKSLPPANDAKPTKAVTAKKGKLADPAQREMLLPISGKKAASAEEAAKSQPKAPARRRAG